MMQGLSMLNSSVWYKLSEVEPRHEQVVIISDGNLVDIAEFVKNSDGYYFDCWDWWDWDVEPTHWAELPELPNTA